MNAVQGILVAVSVAVFIYLAIAMFKPEWFPLQRARPRRLS
jgi:K+-transporting ATPase KdpF subunit